jgi:hypothetical protein
MTKDKLAANLGTVARSGTTGFLNYEEHSPGKAGRNDVFDPSIVDPRFNGLANPKNVNFIRGENGPADKAHVFLSNTKQALASSSPYIDNRDGLIQSFQNSIRRIR